MLTVLMLIVPFAFICSIVAESVIYLYELLIAPEYPA